MDDRDALQILTDRRGNMYDPHVVDAFLVLHAQGLGEAAAPAAAPAAREYSAPPAPGSPAPVDETHEVRDLQTFFELGRAAAQATAAEGLGEALWTHLGERLPASAFVLFGYDEESDAIVAIYTAGAPAAGRLVSAPVALGDRLSGWVAATGRTVMNSDARLDLDEQVRETSALRSALAVRVATAGGSSGVLSFYSETPNVFDDSHLRLVEGAARALGAAAISLSPEPAASTFRNDTRVFRNMKPA
jgi:hypothetical protein